MEVNEITNVLYHANCMDGFASAYVIWKQQKCKAQFTPVQYGDPVPYFCKDANAVVVIVDFSFPREQLLELKACCKELLVIDHHRTAQAELEGLDFCVFDIHHSGCVLTQKYFPCDWFFTNNTMVLEYIEDRDLWDWSLPNSREFSAVLFSYPTDFGMWDLLFSEYDEAEFIKEGSAILRFQNKLIERACKSAVRMPFDRYKAMVINSTQFISEIGNQLCLRNPEAAFAAIWFYDHNKSKYVWSLRSVGDFDVSEVAKQFGGGGHKNAAGFTVNHLCHQGLLGIHPIHPIIKETV